MSERSKPLSFSVKNLSLNTFNEIHQNGFTLTVFHSEDDPASANRVKVSGKNVAVEMLPSKGFSVGQAWINGKPVFWEAPVGLPDTESIDLWSDEISINGNPSAGFTFLKTLTGGVELYGLKNWGMPTLIDGKLYPLHGETSNIPVNEVHFDVNEDVCSIQTSFLYKTFIGNHSIPWYERGESLYRITKKLILTGDSLKFGIEDVIENISQPNQVPSWGYHITLKPQIGARYLVPSHFAQERGFGPFPEDIETWYPAVDGSIRTETGIIHKQILHSHSPEGDNQVNSLLVYPNNTGISVSVPPSPYFQTWFCCGGKNSKEFTLRNGNSILHKNWDGMGIEIGSNPLDHNGNTDESVNYIPILKPGEEKVVRINFKFLEGKELNDLKEVINTYTIQRKCFAGT